MPAARTLLLLYFLTAASNSWAVITPIAITGDIVPGLSGAQYATFGYAQLNVDGQGVYSATLQTGLGGISATNDKVLVTFNGALAFHAQTGSGNVAGAVGKDYATFKEFKIADSGDVLLKATLVEVGDVNPDNRLGYWRFSNNAGSLITRTGTSAVPGATSATFFDLGARVGAANTGDFAFLGQLNLGNGVNTNNDLGVWHFQNSTGTLIARENTSAPDVVSGLFASFGQPVTNGSNQIAFRSNMKTVGSITMANRLGVWVYDNGVGQLIARAGSADVPGSTSDFTAFEDPLINESGQVVIRGTLATGQQGLWLYTGTSGSKVALTNEVGVPELPTASFAGLSKPLLTDSGQVIALGTLNTSVGGVTAGDDTGLWMFDETGGDQLLAREGVGGVAGIAGASFATFERFAPVDDTGIYLNATLQASPGIVNASNDEGIWRIPFEGAPELLLRKGDSLTGRTIADLWLPAGEFDESPILGISNASGELLFHASFTNGDAGLFLYSPSTVSEFADADFNQDGDVDGADLADWQGAFGTSAAGDTDDDGDTDGADFLTWQRQYTGPGTLVEVRAVPEPGVSLLFSFAAFCVIVRVRFNGLGQR